MIKVSVIIPVFNTEEYYLKECLDSVINQTLNDIEIICINDGSTNNSLDILNEYTKKDNRIKIFSQENKGLSAARNYGLKHVNGKYTYFIDSDDMLKPNTLEETYNICEEKSLDFLIFKLSILNENTEKKYNKDYYKIPLKDYENKVFNYKDLGNLIFEIPVNAVNKIYNSEFIKKSGAKFPEGLIFEDNVFNWTVLFNAKRISFYDKEFYIRRIHLNSITTNKDKSFIDTIKINNMIIEEFIKHDQFKNENKHILYNKKISIVYHRFKEIDIEYRSLFFTEMKKDFLNMLNDSKFNDIINYLDLNNKDIFESVIFSKSYKNLNNHININDLKVYDTCRIDIKNKGNNNHIEIIENNDNLDIKEPNWFKDKTGIGYTIENDKNSLNLKFKCIGNGVINIILKGPDRRDKNNNRFPIYIDYTNFLINNEIILNKHQLVWHDKPYIYKKDVKNGEIIKLHIEWLPFNKNSLYNNEEKVLKEKISKMKKEDNKLKTENNNLKEKYNNLKKEHEEILSSNSWKITKPLRNIKNKF
ncbi:hypothetical protein BGI41_02185 [Methanobrevibacter sp. 87.7]|uniref:glycosyltransferase family 2 protein n=1 Tax=Methanobrevibacter sp. 87.7 TaxID=387957 RepID=UPI000B6715A7|nr:glycosyltransferase [Methanobrevibacter sp. 87.7]OWT33488.1 hypothetical protein BGI41_02185 [Methanobrevibacter sp. 87.7]